MKPRAFRLTDRARNDLVEIRAYLACERPRAADRLVSELADKIAWAAESGHRGVPRHEIKDGLRAMLHGNHCIYFFIDDDRLTTVLRVLHGAREVRLQSFPEAD